MTSNKVNHNYKIGHTSQFADDSPMSTVKEELDTPSPSSVHVESPLEISVRSPAATIEKCNNKIRNKLKLEWERERKCKSFYFNSCGWATSSLNDNSFDDSLTLREIKEIIRPYVKSDWYIEIVIFNKHSCFSKSYHATIEFLDDTTNDEEKLPVKTMFYLKNPNKKYINHIIPLWPISLLIFSFFISLSISQKTGVPAFLGAFLSIVAFSIFTKIPIILKSFTIGKYSTLVDIVSREDF